MKRFLKNSSIFLLLFVLLVSCQSVVPELEQTSPELDKLINQDDVLILFTDSAPTFLMSQTASYRPFLKPGTVDVSSASSSESGFSTQSLSTQAFNYTEAAELYAIMLANLLGRYEDLNIVIQPVSTYEQGSAQLSTRTFYVGSTYADPVPAALINDALSGAPITWINYQIWNLVPFTGNSAVGEHPLGFSYNTLHASYDEASYTTTYNKIDYRDFTFDKYLAPMEMIEVKAERDDVVVHAWAQNSTGKRIPYALQSGQFWYIADNPFVYIHETDRYLIFADLLGPMLGRNETCEPRAIARMEDLSPNDDYIDLRRMLNALRRVNIPFAAATIPLYKNNDTGVTQTWNENPQALRQLRRVSRIKGRIFQHGYSHQFEAFNNPSGETGTDFEFWQATDNGTGGFNYIGPIPGQTPADALARVSAGNTLLRNLGLNPTGWVTPHYAANPDFYDSFNTIYPRVMERRLYQVGSTVAGQFFPYPVKDVAGTLILPETLGSLQPGYLLDRIMAAANANKAMHCPWAGHFFHAYTLNPSYNGPNAISRAQFEKLLKDIQALGYTYIDPLSVSLQ